MLQGNFKIKLLEQFSFRKHNVKSSRNSRTLRIFPSRGWLAQKRGALLVVCLVTAPSEEVALHFCLFLACLTCSSIYLVRLGQPVAGGGLDAA